MFTENEFELLMKALDALESKASSDMLVTGMLKIGFSSSKEEAENTTQEVMNEWEEFAEKQKGLKNQIILMKAKLIQMQDSMAIEEAKNFLEGN